MCPLGHGPQSQTKDGETLADYHGGDKCPPITEFVQAVEKLMVKLAVHQGIIVQFVQFDVDNHPDEWNVTWIRKEESQPHVEH